jgi:hypothetical protein
MPDNGGHSLVCARRHANCCGYTLRENTPANGFEVVLGVPVVFFAIRRRRAQTFGARDTPFSHALNPGRR